MLVEYADDILGRPRYVLFVRVAALSRRVPLRCRQLLFRQLASAVLAALALGLIGCGHTAPFRANLELLRPWNAAEDASQSGPFAARFVKGDNKLTFVAAQHTTSLDHPTITLLRRELKLLSPEVVVVEGPSRSKGLSPKPLVERATQLAPTEMVRRYHEAGVAMRWAVAHDVGFVGAEPSSAELAGRYVARGKGTLEDLALFYLVRKIPQWRRQGHDLGKDFPARFSAFMLALAKRLSVPPASLPKIDALHRWYEAGNRKPFDPRAIKSGECAPISGEKALRTQRINFTINHLRNEQIALTITEMLNTYDKVLVIYGGGHFMQHELVLTAMLGPPREIVRAR